MSRSAILRSYFIWLWYVQSDPAMEDVLYETESTRCFAGLELTDDALPDERTIFTFRHLLEHYGLTAQKMSLINDTQAQQGLLLKGSKMGDATILHAPPSTKSLGWQCDPEMHQTQRGNQWYLGMKAHVGGSWGVSLKANKQHPLTQANKHFSHRTASIRAGVQHVFRVFNRQFGDTKAHYKGVAKNAAQVFSLIGLTNLYLVRRALLS